MKVIFLDVDGVLNYMTCDAKSPCGAYGVEDRCIEVLAKIVKKSDAIIVLISSWKHFWYNDESENNGLDEDFKYLVYALAKHDIYMSDRTYDGNFERGFGISEWLKQHTNTTDWVVIDDDMFPDYEEYGIVPHLVMPSFYTGGLKEEHISKCLQILNIKEEEHGS